MNVFNASTLDNSVAINTLKKDGYIVIENVLSKSTVTQIIDEINIIFENERSNPFNPQVQAPSKDDKHLRE